MNKKLKSAVCSGKLEEVKNIIASVDLSNLNCWSNSEGCILLRDALYHDQSEIAELFLNKGAKVNCGSGRRSDTPLHFAVRNKDHKIVEMILNREARVDAVNKEGLTSLHIAAERGLTPAVELLLNFGASVNCWCKSISHISSWYTPLHFAVQMGNVEIVKMIVKKGANINKQKQNCMSPLHVAAHLGFLNIADYLIDEGANVNSCCVFLTGDGFTPLHLAVINGYEEVAELLLMSDSDVNALNKRGETSLHLAVQKNREQIVELLIDYQANINVHINVQSQNVLAQHGDTPLHIAVKNKHEKMINFLLEHGANINSVNNEKKTPLLLAVELEQPLIVKELLEGMPDQIVRENQLALCTAVQKSGQICKNIVEGLLNYGFGVTEKDVDNPKLIIGSVDRGYTKLVEDLLIFGADVNTKRDNLSLWGKGDTLLHCAVKKENEDMIKLLINHGCDINATNGEGRTSIFYAKKKKNLDIVNILLHNKASVEVCDQEGATPLHVTVSSSGSSSEDAREALLPH